MSKYQVTMVHSSDNMLEELWCREVKIDEQVLDMPPTFEKVAFLFFILFNFLFHVRGSGLDT